MCFAEIISLMDYTYTYSEFVILFCLDPSGEMIL